MFFVVGVVLSIAMWRSGEEANNNDSLPMTFKMDT